ncbi:hypothetical protein RP20_CCG006794 [Aedes albopictus]|nr:hypothetical protein RP20_CCG006794 [Aedes albopictus]
MNVAGKFDDVVLFLDDRKEVWFFQAKHSQTLNAEIDYKEFVPSNFEENTQFSLPMYIQSFLNVSQQCEFMNYRKRCIIYSNKTIAESSRVKLNKLMDIKVCTADDQLGKQVFETCEGRSEVLVPKAKKIQDILNKFNKLPIAVKDAIIELQESGTVRSILRKYTTPLRSILNINGAVGFAKRFTENQDDINQRWLLYELQKYYSNKSLSDVVFNKKLDKRLLQNKSVETNFPRFIDEDNLKSFFDSLVICTDQPDKLCRFRDNITESFVGKWIHEKDRGLFSDGIKFNAIFENEFEDWHKVTNMNKNQKPFLRSYEGNKCVRMIKADLRKSLHKMSEADFSNYVERKLVYPYGREELTEDEFVSKLEHTSGHNANFILVSEPGMGKSTFMKKITFLLQTDYNKHVYLICLSTLFKHYKAENDILTLMKSNLSISIQQLVQNSLENTPQQCFILLDGFDEIHTSHQIAAIKLIKNTFCKNNIRVFISGRNHVKETLEMAFQAKALKLAPFDADDQLLFLRKYWLTNSGIVGKDYDRFLIFAKHLLKVLHDNIQSVNFRFTGLPLVILMLAEANREKFEKYWKSTDENNDEIFDSVNKVSLLRLYESFVNISFNIFVRKIKNEDGYATVDLKTIKFYKCNLQKFYRAHQLLAIRQLSIPMLHDLLGIGDSVTILENMQQILDKGEKSLLINVSNENKLQFTHLSYAEFFLSKFLYEHVSKCEAILFNVLDTYEVVRSFFLTMIEENVNNSLLHISTISNICHKDPEIMYIVCSDGYELILKELLKHHKAKVKFRQRFSVKGGTLLHAAINSKKINILKLILCEHQFGDCTLHKGNSKTIVTSGTEIDINTPDSWGSLPIHYAVADGNKPFFEFLAKHGADKYINAQDLNGSTPIHYAAIASDWEMVKMLTANYSAKPNIRDGVGKTILHIAAAKRDLNVVKMMITELSCDPNVEDDKGETPLHYAVYLGEWEMAKIMIGKYSGSYGITGTNGQPLLHYAIKGGNKEIVKMLIDDYAADVNAQDVNGYTPLHVAVECGTLEMVKMLCNKYSADYKIADKYGKYLIHSAAEGGNLEILEMLVVDLFFSVNTQDNHGCTPLHFAARGGKREMAKVLIVRYRANVDTTDENGLTPALTAAMHHKWCVVKMLLVNFSLDVNATNDHGQTLLHLAAANGDLEAVQFLISYQSANTNCLDNKGRSPSQVAAERGHCKVVNELTKAQNTEAAPLLQNRLLSTFLQN